MLCLYLGRSWPFSREWSNTKHITQSLNIFKDDQFEPIFFQQEVLSKIAVLKFFWKVFKKGKRKTQVWTG